MLPNIQEKYDSLSEKRRTLLQHLESLPPEVLSYKAGPDKWSVQEAIEHPVVVEDNFLEQVKANVPSSSLDADKRSLEKYQTVLKVMKRDVKVDVPHESMEPRGHFSFSELLHKWDNIRKKMQALLEETETNTQGDLVYQHPYAGPLNLAETMEFIEVHFDNHVRHLDVILTRAEP